MANRLSGIYTFEDLRTSRALLAIFSCPAAIFGAAQAIGWNDLPREGLRSMIPTSVTLAIKIVVAMMTLMIVLRTLEVANSHPLEEHRMHYLRREVLLWLRRQQELSHQNWYCYYNYCCWSFRNNLGALLSTPFIKPSDYGIPYERHTAEIALLHERLLPNRDQRIDIVPRNHNLEPFMRAVTTEYTYISQHKIDDTQFQYAASELVLSNIFYRRVPDQGDAFQQILGTSANDFGWKDIYYPLVQFLFLNNPEARTDMLFYEENFEIYLGRTPDDLESKRFKLLVTRMNLEFYFYHIKQALEADANTAAQSAISAQILQQSIENNFISLTAFTNSVLVKTRAAIEEIQRDTNLIFAPEV